MKPRGGHPTSPTSSGGGSLVGWSFRFDLRPHPVVQQEGHRLHGGFDEADGEGGAPVAGDGVGDGDRDHEVHQRVSAGLQGEAHWWKIVVLRMVRK